MLSVRNTNCLQFAIVKLAATPILLRGRWSTLFRFRRVTYSVFSSVARRGLRKDQGLYILSGFPAIISQSVFIIRICFCHAATAFSSNQIADGHVLKRSAIHVFRLHLLMDMTELVSCWLVGSSLRDFTDWSCMVKCSTRVAIDPNWTSRRR